MNKGTPLYGLHYLRAWSCWCTAWVLTEDDNLAARALYASAGGVEAQQLMVEFNLNNV